MNSVADSPSAVKAATVLRAERGREYAAIHRLSCRYKARDLVCSTCHDLDARAVRLAKLAGEVVT